MSDNAFGHLTFPVDANEFSALHGFLAEYSGADVMWLGGSVDTVTPARTYTSGRADASFALSGGVIQQRHLLPTLRQAPAAAAPCCRSVRGCSNWTYV